MNRNIFLPLLTTEPQTINLFDMKEASLFDNFRFVIDKTAFYKLEPFFENDELLACRKAQLLIDEGALEQAIALLSSLSNLLAEGLMAQALAKSEAWSVVHVYINPYLIWSKEKCLGSSPSDQEGLVHIFEAAYLYAVADKNYDYALFLLERSYFLAEALMLKQTANRLQNSKLDLLKLVNPSH